MARNRRTSKTAKKRRSPSKPKARDLRTRAAGAIAQDGVPLDREHRLVVMQSVRDSEGAFRYFPSPLADALDLLTARDLRKKGELARVRAWKTCNTPFDQGATTTDERAANDALAYLSSAVLLSFAAIEAYANEKISGLPPQTELKVGKRVVSQPDMARQLSMEDKLKRVVPLATERPSIAGTALWEEFLGLKDLRDDLVHLKERGFSSDSAAETPFGRLMLGEAANCVEVAARVIQANEPTRIPEVTNALGIPPLAG